MQHISNAAMVLHITQSALSKIINRVEDYAGMPLFDRVKGKICLLYTSGHQRDRTQRHAHHRQDNFPPAANASGGGEPPQMLSLIHILAESCQEAVVFPFLHARGGSTEPCCRPLAVLVIRKVARA